MKLDELGTRLFAADGGGAEPVQVDPSQTVDPDGTGPFVNPAGDGRRSEAFADWNLDPAMPGKAEPQIGKPEPKTLDAVLEGKLEEPALDNPEGDRPPLEDPTKQKADRPDAAPDPDATAGDEGGETPDPTESAVDGILAKYETKEKLAKGYKHIQQLATKTGKEKQVLERELAEAVDLRDRFLEKTDDGEYSLRTDMAVAALQRGTPPPTMVNQAEIMEQAAAEQRKYLSETLEILDDDLEDAMQRSGEAIQARAKQMYDARQGEIRAHMNEQQGKAAHVVNNFFTTNPKFMDDEVKESINAWYGRFPHHLRSQLILNGFLPLEAVADSAYREVNFKKAIREAYDAGVKANAAEIEPSTASAPSPGQRAPANRGAANSPEDSIKAGILGAGVLPSIFDELG